MCLMIYIASEHALPARQNEYLTIEPMKTDDASVAQWFSYSHVYFVGVPTGCSCGVPYIIADEPTDYYEGMFEDNEDHRKNIKSLDSIRQYLSEYIKSGETIELYPVWYDNLDEPPKGRISWNLNQLNPYTSFFVEQFMYEITAEPGVVADLSRLQEPYSAKR